MSIESSLPLGKLLKLTLSNRTFEARIFALDVRLEHPEKVPNGFSIIRLSNSERGVVESLFGGGLRKFCLDLYEVGSRRMERGRASVMGVEPSADGGTRGSVAENP